MEESSTDPATLQPPMLTLRPPSLTSDDFEKIARLVLKFSTEIDQDTSDSHSNRSAIHCDPEVMSCGDITSGSKLDALDDSALDSEMIQLSYSHASDVVDVNLKSDMADMNLSRFQSPVSFSPDPIKTTIVTPSSNGLMWLLDEDHEQTTA
jgi:hypothetical protein